MDSSLTKENFQKAANELKGEYSSMLVGCDLACASSDATSVTVVDNLTATTVNTITKCDDGYYSMLKLEHN